MRDDEPLWAGTKGYVLSIPVLLALVACLTQGNVAMLSVRTLVEHILTLVGASFIVLLMVASTRGRRDGDLAFGTFRIVLPLVACVALGVKVVPIPVVNEGFFRAIMTLSFALVMPVLWSFVLFASDCRRRRTFWLCQLTLALCAAAWLVGLASALLDDDWRLACMGVATSGYLIYASVCLVRNIVEYNKPTDDEPAAVPPDLDAACRSIADRAGLTPRERDVLLELAHGHSSGYIAEVLCIAPNTARTHMKNIYRKLGVSSREELLADVWEKGRAE